MAANSATTEAESKLMVSTSTTITTTTTKLCCCCFKSLISLLIILLLSVNHHHLALGQTLISCESKSLDASGYRCNGFGSQDRCATFALFRANSYYSSLFNLSFYLGLNKKAIDAANGFNPKVDLLLKDQALLIPIDCRCNGGAGGGFFEAEVTKTTTKGETFVGISESLEGLTTCKAIQEKNKGLSPWNLKEKIRVPIPLRCACPSQLEFNQGTKILLSYPVSVGDTVLKLASKFNTTAGAIISSNNRGGGPFKPEKLEPISTLLIPLTKKPILTSFFPNARQPNLGTIIPNSKGMPVISPPKKRKKKKSKIGVYVAVSVIAAGACAAAAVILVTRMKKKEKVKRGQAFSKNDEDLELHHLSIRTKSELKGVSDTFDGQVIDTTPHKMVVETYSIEDLRKSTEDFHSSNLIEGFVFHGRLNGKNLAVKRTQPETISRIDFGLFHDQFHHHPNIIRLLGTCLVDGPDSFLVFEYAKNGSLKDWLHGGLAMKSQFIASCYCFLTWKQRLKICLDVAMSLRYMHHFMNPSYVHRNIKSRNILLDEEFNAKVGNFGMSRCVQDDAEDSKSLLTHPATWSRGYLAPEYLKHGVISSSVDIFAYGVVLLEVLTGKTPATRADEKGEGSVLLSEKIKSIIESGDTNELKEWVDKAMGDSYSFETALTLAKLAKECVQQDPSLRPNAREIADKLSKLVDELPDGDQNSSGGSSSKSPAKVPSSDYV